MPESAPEFTPGTSDLYTTNAGVTQLAIPGVCVNRVYPKRRTDKSAGVRQPVNGTEDSLVRPYLRRLGARGAAPNTAAAYAYQLATIVRAAARLGGQTVDLGQLFRDSVLLGRALANDVVPGRDARLSRWTMAQRRSAIRSFASLMRPELMQLLGDDPHMALDQSLRGVAERVGSGYRLAGGRPRHRVGHAPTPDEIAAVMAAAAGEPGFLGARNRAFLGILSATGARVNALRHLDGTDFVVLPSGRVRLHLHEKGKAEPRQVELDRVHADALLGYAESFNRHALRQGWRVRVSLGTSGAIWRNSDRGRWSYQSVRTSLTAACAKAGVPVFTPHDLRRALATDASSFLPRHTVALAGGWKGVERMDDHYVRPRVPTLWLKLQQVQERSDVERDETVVAAAAVIS